MKCDVKKSLLQSKMADNSAKLKAEIAYLTNLIKSHKQTAPINGSKRQTSSIMHFSNDKSKRSFSWQRSEQPAKEKQSAVSQSLSHVQGKTAVTKSSLSLDRRKMVARTLGSAVTTATSLNTQAIPGSSSLQPFLSTKATNSSVLKNDTARKQTVSSVSALEPTVPARTPMLVSHSSSPTKCNVKLAPSSPKQITGLSAKNPYVLNKKATSSVSSVKTVAQKSDLKWSKPGLTGSTVSADNSKSYSDSELYTKKSSLPSTAQPSSVSLSKGKSTALILNKGPSTSNVRGSFKWSKPSVTVTNLTGRRKSVKKPKLAKSKLKWTKPGIHTQTRRKPQVNPYVLRKGNLSSENKTQKKGIASSTAVTSYKMAKKTVNSKSNEGFRIWRAPSSLKLDRRKSQLSSKLLSRQSSAGFIQRRQRAVLRDSSVVTRYSVVRSKRKQAPIKAQKLNKVVVIGGVPYKTSSNKLTKTKASSTTAEQRKKTSAPESLKRGKMSKTVTIQGEKFVMDSKGKTLHRVNKVPRRLSISKQNQVLTGRRRSSNGRMTVLCTWTTLVKAKASNSQNQTLASRVLRRSIHNARLFHKNKKKPASEQYCMFYNRFGKCNKQDTCPYIHDPSKVAVCTKFLRGRCKNLDGSCPFSHKIDRDKMPVCQFFLRGTCSNDNCPYSHVNVSKKAEVCEDFLKGFCALGQQCNKKHILECEEFARTGECSKGSKCKLMHRTRKSALRKRKTSTKEENTAKVSKLDFTNDDGFLPLTASISDSGLSSAQEPLDNTTTDETKQMAEPLVIRPRFLRTKESEK
ncbi:uncharacterized protein [Porites lutea]|uniref:uncharacterized protein isoform X2 n=1 Tax=Porites lutea TaxID=51062 RepID=UPI003CC6B41F